jgi:hypothetical protein
MFVGRYKRINLCKRETLAKGKSPERDFAKNSR